MTIEDKAQAYDTAIRKAQDVYHTSEFVKITDLFPELVESEDERVRKTLSVLVQNAIYPGLITEKDSKKCLTYLEKQKERGPLTKEEEYILQRIIEYLEDETCPSEWINLLHGIYCLPYGKQKENIEKEYVFRPLGGTDITVAAGQAIKKVNEGERLVLAFNGVYIPVLKGYDVNEIVDIYNTFVERRKEPPFVKDVNVGYPGHYFYDGERMYLCSSPDIEEKQKENPKYSDSIPSDCTVGAKCEDRWHKVKDSLPDTSREVLCKDAIGNFFIGRYYRNSQCWKVMMYDDCDKSNEDNPPVVEWCEIPSEKQKEQKTTNELEDAFKYYTDRGITISCGDFKAEPKKEQIGEYGECTDFTIYHPLKNEKGEYECIPYSFYGSLTSFSEDKDLIDFLRTCFYTEEECNEWIEKQKEQNSVECIEFDNEFEKQVSHLLASVLNGEWEYDEGFVKHAAQSLLGYAKHELELDGKALLYTADKSYQIGFRDGVASVKPAEWSKKDEKMIERLITRLNWITYNTRTDGTSPNITFFDEIDWLKSLRPQSQGIYQQVVKGIREMCDRYEQNGMFTDERARDFLGNVRVKCKDTIECAPILDEPSWKPSEEQMEALLNAEGFLRAGLQHDSAKIIAELYEQLKKL